MEPGTSAQSSVAAPVIPSRRAIKTMHHIQEEAMRLFLVKGYEATTVEEIAAAAGVSHMTVYRHFPTKESLVLGDEYDPVIAAEIRQRPPDEPPLDSVEHAIISVLERIPEQDFNLVIERTRLIMATPALQEGLWINSLETHRVISDALIARGGVPDDPFALRVLAASAAVTAGLAVLQWMSGQDDRSFIELLHAAFAAARQAFMAPPAERSEPRQGDR